MTRSRAWAETSSAFSWIPGPSRKKSAASRTSCCTPCASRSRCRGWRCGSRRASASHRFPAHARDVEELLKHADIAMYQAKASAQRLRVLRASSTTPTRKRGCCSPANWQPRSTATTSSCTTSRRPKLPRAGSPVSRRSYACACRTAGSCRQLEFLPTAEHAGLSRRLTRRVLSDRTRPTCDLACGRARSRPGRQHDRRRSHRRELPARGRR